MLRRLRSRPLARVVKLVDTGDLKSPDHCDRAGSSPAPGTTLEVTTIFSLAPRCANGAFALRPQPCTVKLQVVVVPHAY